MSLRIIFMGSPDFAVPTLKRLVEDGHDVTCVYSQPPRPSGRGKAVRETPVHAEAKRLGIEVRTPANFTLAEDRAAFAELKADLAVVVAYGLLLPQAVLDATRLGCFNLHGSLLPRWRGAAPIQRAIMAGDAKTGVEVMKMEKGLDTGPVLMSAETDIAETDTYGAVHDRLAAIGAGLMSKAVKALEAGPVQLTPQASGGVAYAEKISANEAHIDWTRDAGAVSAHIRGLSPSPGAWFEFASERGLMRVKVLEVRTEPGEGAPGAVLDDRLLVACRTGAVRLIRLQRAGKGPTFAEDFLRGTSVQAGDRLS